MIKLSSKYLLFLISLMWLCLSANLIAQAPPSVPDHSALTQLLQQHVDDEGLVDYTAMKANRAPLDQYLQSIAETSSQALSDAPESHRLAYWINAYNAYTLQVIIDHYPIEPRAFGGWFAPDNSIKQIKGVWDELQFDTAEGPVTLDAIEHNIIRPRFDEPRIHFVLVCASLSCPELRQQAYTGDQLESQLAAQQQRFLSDQAKGLALDGNSLMLSRIFKWYAEDFDAKGTDLPEFSGFSESEAGVLRYLLQNLESRGATELIRNNQFDLEYLDYDWSLNDQA